MDLVRVAEQWQAATRRMILIDPALLTDPDVVAAVASLAPSGGGPVVSMANGRGALDLGILPTKARTRWRCLMARRQCVGWSCLMVIRP